MEVRSVRVSTRWHLLWVKNVALTERAEEFVRANHTGYFLQRPLLSPSCVVIFVVMKLRAENEEYFSLWSGPGGCKWKRPKGHSSTKCTVWGTGRALKSRKEEKNNTDTPKKDNQFNHTVIRCYFSPQSFTLVTQLLLQPDRKKNKEATVGCWWGQITEQFDYAVSKVPQIPAWVKSVWPWALTVPGQWRLRGPADGYWYSNLGRGKGRLERRKPALLRC